ncbi:MAG: energy-coupling factor ABC transporter ATP-binding protein [Bacilli bacterium]|jgi:energy-coupling factor transport system ATP-binding protein
MEIKIDKLTYIYNYKTPLAKKALEDLSLSLEKGLIHGIIGSSGSGKTTLAELLNGLMMPTKGELVIGSYKLNKRISFQQLKELRFNVGLVFQTPEEQFFNPTVQEEIEFALKNFDYKTEELEERVMKALKMVGLEERYLKENPFSLSAGEKRRIAIASVLVFNPQVIIFDEPTVGLDYRSKRLLIKLIKRLKNRYKKTIIVCSHDIELIYHLVDYVVLLKEGHVIAEGKKEEFFENFDLLLDEGIKLPKSLEFVYKVKMKKGIRLENKLDIQELIKEVYRHVQ